MKTGTVILFIVNLFVSNLLKAGPDTLDWNPIGGSIIWKITGEDKIQDTYLINVFQSLTTNGFVIKDVHERKEDEIYIHGVDFHTEESNILFRVGCYVSSDTIEGGQKALEYALTHYYTSMVPPWFRQYMEGPGNVCLIPIKSNVTQPKTMSSVFFVRGNIAVRMQNLRGGDILTFAKIFDECILASSVKESAGKANATQEATSETSPKPATTNKPQQSSTKDKSVEEQQLQPDDAIPPSPPVSMDAENVADGMQSDLQFHIWIALFLCLCAIAYFVRKKIKQRSTSRLRK